MDSRVLTPRQRSSARRPISYVLIALLLAAFVLLANALPSSGGTSVDIAIAQWLTTVNGDMAQIIFTWISWLGDTALSGLLIAAVLFLAHRKRYLASVTIAVASLGAMFLNPVLKEWFHRGRPVYAIELLAGPTWSFPSGHAMVSLVGFGIVAYFRRKYERNALKRLAIVVGTCAVVAAVGFSRLYLAVHYPSDVLGGFLAGGAWLLICIEAYRLIADHMANTRNRRA